MHFAHHRLGNGLRVWAQRHGTAPLAAVYLWIDCGTRDERDGEHGAAHLLEHMIFKGTPTRPVGAAAAEIEGLGGDLNAYTAHDQTVLHATVLTSGLDQALDVLADMALRSCLSDEDLLLEREVVLDEIARYDDDPDTVVGDRANERVFASHPYGRPVLGTRESVRGIDADALRAFHRRGYGPGRAGVAVAGDVDPDEVFAAVARHFGSWTGGEPRRALGEPAPPPTTVHQVDGRFGTTLVELTWPAVPRRHPDAAALEILMSSLGDGSASVLTTRLHLEDKVAHDVWSSTDLRQRGGSVSVGFRPTAGHTREALAAALAELDAITRGGVTGRQVDRARQVILSDMLFAQETVDGVAHDLVTYGMLDGDPGARRRHRNALAAVSHDDVREVARRYLTRDAMQTVVLDRKLDPPKLRRALRPSKPRSRGAEPKQTVLDNGATLWVMPDPSPVAAAVAVGLGGGLFDKPGRQGLGTLWAETVAGAAGDMMATEFSEALDAVAATLTGASSPSTWSIRSTFPSAYASDALDLFGMALLEPRFDPEEVERVRQTLIDDAETRSDRPGEVAQLLVWQSLFAGHPWRLTPGGSVSSLQRLGGRGLVRRHDRLVTGPNTVVAVCGGVDPVEVEDQLGAWLADLPSDQVHLPERRVPEAPPARSRTRRAGREQAYVVLATRGLRATDPTRHALSLGAAILGGQGGRLFVSLREERGLAYSVWSTARTGWDGGVFQVGAATSPEAAAEVRSVLRDGLHRLAATPPDPIELDRYRQMLLGLAAMDRQRTSARAGIAALGDRMGIPSSLEAYRQALHAVTPEAVRDAAAAALGRGLVEVVVAP